MALTHEEALAVYRVGPEAVVLTLCALSRKFDELQEEHVRIQGRVKELEGQVAKNSRNSSKPPSSDGPKKPKPRSLRPKGKRKPGGQKGHKGHTLQATEHPDHTVVHEVHECEECHRDISGEKATGVKKRQVFDVPPPPRIESTEHQAEIKPCPHCDHVNTAAFPEGVNAPVQYGPRVKAIAMYLREYQLLPSQRTCECLRDLLRCEMSEGTLANIVKATSEILEEPVAKIAQQIAAAQVAHFDETSCRVEGDRGWLHVSSTESLTFYGVHRKRGTLAMDDIGILPLFGGRAIHDHWKPYFTYECEHGLCNAHHLRELIFVHEQHGQNWAQEMIDCLLDIKGAVDKARVFSDHLPPKQLREFEACYQEILERGYAENPLPKPPKKKKRGPQKKSKSRNLLERLDEYRRETLAFMYDFNVPFDNNLGERDVRMTKVQQKISGTFRSWGGARSFCRIRSYISTARKKSVDAIDALRTAFIGEPCLVIG